MSVGGGVLGATSPEVSSGYGGSGDLLHIYGRVEAMLPRVEALAADRTQRESSLHVRLLQAEASRRRWKTAYIELPLLANPKIIELQGKDSEDSRNCHALFDVDDSGPEEKATALVATTFEPVAPLSTQQLMDSNKSMVNKIVEALELKKKAVEEAIAKLKKSLAAEQQQAHLLKEQLSTAKSTNQAKLETIEKDYAKLKKSLAAEQQQVQLLKEQLSTAKSNEAKLETIEEDYAKLKKSLAAEQQQLQLLKEQLSTTKSNQAKLETIEKDYAKLKKSLAAEQQQVQLLKDQLSTAKSNQAKLETIEEDYAKLKKSLAAEQQQVQLLKEQLSTGAISPKLLKGPNMADEKNNKGPDTRCNPGCLTCLYPHLPQRVVDMIDELELTKLKMDKLQLTSLSYRSTCGVLWGKSIVRTEINIIEIPIKGGVSLWITKNVVQHILDLPNGDDQEFPNEDTTEEFQKMVMALKYARLQWGDEVTAKERRIYSKPFEEIDFEFRRKLFTQSNIILLCKHADDDDVAPLADTTMLVRLYLGTVVDRMLLPSSGNYLARTATDSVHRVDKLSGMDWPHLVFERLKDVCKDKTLKTKKLNCCLPVLLVAFMDCIVGNPVTMEGSGRIYLYTDDHLKELLEHKGKRKRGGMKNLKSLESMDLIRWEDSCYGRITMSKHDRLRDTYQKRVLDRMRDDIVIKFAHYQIAESVYVECLKPTGRMYSDVLHLVCDLWSMQWDDTIILSEYAVKELVEGNGFKSVDMDLTPEKVKRAKKIHIPIVSCGHISLVVVCISMKTNYILDSLPKRHETEARAVLTNLQSYLTKHEIDISSYEEETPKIKPQDNNCDCGFHVLLYIKGFEQMDIFDITTEKVFDLRMELSSELLDHEMNAVDEVIVDTDKDGEKEGDDPVSPLHASENTHTGMEDGTSASMEAPVEKNDEGKEQEDSPRHNDDGHQIDHTSPVQASENTHTDTPISLEDGTSASMEAPVGENDEDKKQEDSPQHNDDGHQIDHAVSPVQASGYKEQADSPVNSGTGEVEEKENAEEEGENPDSERAPNTTLKTPAGARRGSRFTKDKSNPLQIKDVEVLSRKQVDDIWILIEEKRDIAMFKVGGTSLTGVELLKCLDEDTSALKLMDAFVECLKFDDLEEGLNDKRIIIPPQQEVGDELIQTITKEIGEAKMQKITKENEKAKKTKGEKAKQTKGEDCTLELFIYCPFVHQDETFVVFVNSKGSNEVSVSYCKDSKVDYDTVLQGTARKFAELVDNAFKECHCISPFKKSQPRVSSPLLEASRKDSAFACMVFIQRFNGSNVPLDMNSPDKAKEYKKTKLAHLLVHQKNTADVPEIKAIAERNEGNGKKKGDGLNKKRKRTGFCL